ncbi:MAG: hypothetical protein KDN05_01725 [Verrucomicrobiae bacterium]|nr:hypothetical protein [Verrucomicrobiae bacterium]MCP5543143.1 hypothetical protein [Akkermansiaceae bacterium]
MPSLTEREPVVGKADTTEEEQASLWRAVSEARHQVRELIPEHAAMPHNEGVKYFASNPGQDLTARFLEDGRVKFESGIPGRDWAMVFGETGSEPRVVDACRVEIARPHQVTEWYVNRPEGMEHGFHVPSAAADENPEMEGLQLSFPVAGDLVAVGDGVSGDLLLVDSETEQPVLSYRKLLVVDATGRELAARMEAGGGRVAFHVESAGAAYPIVIDPLVGTEEARLGPEMDEDGAPGDRFGYSVAIEDDTAVIGAPNDDTAVANDTGSAYVFVRAAGTWGLEDLLYGNQTASEFGYSVGVSNDTVIVGAPGYDYILDFGHTAGVTTWEDMGGAYIFVRNDSIWSFQASLNPYIFGLGVGNVGDAFGRSVAIEGDRALVGAPLADTSAQDAGRAYLFKRSGSDWSVSYPGDPLNFPGDFHNGFLNAADAAQGDNFGSSVALSGDSALVGADGDDTPAGGNAGSAYVFTRTATGNWSQQTKLTANDAAATDYFGRSVALSGDTALIGALSDENSNGDNAGSAYVFFRDADGWDQQAKLTASDGSASDFFGRSVALEGDVAVIGASNDNNSAGPDAGSAYVFTRRNDSWDQRAKLMGSDSGQQDYFGFAVTISGNTALVGAYGHDGFNGGGGASADQGAAYPFILDGLDPGLELEKEILTEAGHETVTWQSGATINLGQTETGILSWFANLVNTGIPDLEVSAAAVSGPDADAFSASIPPEWELVPSSGFATVIADLPQPFRVEFGSAEYRIREATLTLHTNQPDLPEFVVHFLVDNVARPENLLLNGQDSSVTRVLSENLANPSLGLVTVIDPDTPAGEHVIGFDDTGNHDNASFNLIGSELFFNGTTDYETKSSYTVRLKATDPEGLDGSSSFHVVISDDTTEDFDGDGLTEAEEDALGTSDLDPDSDNDGVNDFADPFPANPSEWLDTDGDGIGNNSDPDDDNDGILDGDDPNPLGRNRVLRSEPLAVPDLTLTTDSRPLTDSSPWKHGVQLGGYIWYLREVFSGSTSLGYRLWKTTEVEEAGEQVLENLFKAPIGSTSNKSVLYALSDRLIIFDTSYEPSANQNTGKVYAYIPGEADVRLLKSGVSWVYSIQFGNKVLWEGRTQIVGDPDFYKGNEPWVTDGTVAGTKLLKELAVVYDTKYTNGVSTNNYTAGFRNPVLAEDGSGVFFESADLDVQGNPYNQGQQFPTAGTRYIAFTDGTAAGTRRLALVSLNDNDYGPMVAHGDAVFYPNLTYSPFYRCRWIRKGGATWDPTVSGFSPGAQYVSGVPSLGKAGGRLWFYVYEQTTVNNSRYGYFNVNSTTPVIVPGLPRENSLISASSVRLGSLGAIAAVYDSASGQWLLKRGDQTGWQTVATYTRTPTLLAGVGDYALLRWYDSVNAEHVLESVQMATGVRTVLVHGPRYFNFSKQLTETSVVLTEGNPAKHWKTDGTMEGTFLFYEQVAGSTNPLNSAERNARILDEGAGQVILPVRARPGTSEAAGEDSDLILDLAWYSERLPEYVEWTPGPGLSLEIPALTYANGLEWTGSTLRWRPAKAGALRVFLPIAAENLTQDLLWGGSVAWRIDGRTIDGGQDGGGVLSVSLSGSAAYELWREQTFGTTANADSAPDSAPFGDGVANLLKFAFNMDATGPDASTLVPITGTSGLPTYELDPNAGEVTLQYIRRKDSGLIYTPQKSGSLDGFEPLGGTETSEDIDGQFERVTVVAPCDPAIEESCFWRVAVELPD